MTDYDLLFHDTADSMCETDAEGVIHRINAACAQMLDGQLNDRLSEVFDGEGQRRLSDAFESLTPEHPAGHFEARHADRDQWTSWQLTRLAADRFVAVGRDITARIRTEVDLEQKSSFLSSIIEAEPECVKLVSPSGVLLDMNRAGLEMIGADSREQVVANSVYSLIVEEDRERYIEFNEQVCRGHGGELSFGVLGLDGTRRCMETVAVPLPRPGSPEELIHLAITRDVTERRMLEEQLRQAQKIEAIGHLAGGVAHDFNNLLTAIIGPAELAAVTLGSEHPAASYLEQIKSTSQRAARLTQKLLAFAQQHAEQPEALSLADLVSNLREMLERLLGETTQLRFDISPDTWTVCMDRGHIEQVVLNLVLNARDAVDAGGSITVSLTNRMLSPQDARRLGGKAGPNVVLEVQDDGIGIPPETMPSIFDPFFTTKPPGRGTGLGLSICFGIIKQSSGTIDVQSAQGTGTSVAIYLPATPQLTPTSEEEIHTEGSSAAAIVVVEDEASVRQAIVNMLEALGHSVAAVQNGAEALELIRSRHDVDLVVSDMAMPGLSGRELAAILADERPELPVLLVTGYLTKAKCGESQDGPAVLGKPFTSEELSAAITQTLARKSTT